MAVADLLAQAEEYLERFEVEEALKCCETALKEEPENVDVLQMTASALIEMSQMDSAKEVRNFSVP